MSLHERPDPVDQVTMKTIISAAIACFLFSTAAAAPAEKTDAAACPDGGTGGKRMEYRGFIGGMMLHTGYVRSADLTITSLSGDVNTIGVSGAPVGIGGAIRFMFGEHLRIGAEGYVSTLNYGKGGASHAETGWGGVLADCVWEFGKYRLFIGGTAGGGSQTNTTILSEIRNDYTAEEDISYRKYGFLAIAPFAGAEYCISPRICLVMKVDWLLNVTNPQDDFVTGPRLYLGFMFGHRR